MVAFCSNQIIGDYKLRLSREDPASNLSTSKQDMQNFLSLRSNKKYHLFREQIDLVCDFVTDHSKCLRDAEGLLSLLKKTFYPGVTYLNTWSLTFLPKENLNYVVFPGSRYQRTIFGLKNWITLISNTLNRFIVLYFSHNKCIWNIIGSTCSFLIIHWLDQKAYTGNLFVLSL